MSDGHGVKPMRKDREEGVFTCGFGLLLPTQDELQKLAKANVIAKTCSETRLLLLMMGSAVCCGFKVSS